MNVKNLIFALPLLAYLLLKYSCISVIPDFFGLYDNDAGDYFGLILNLTASILGVLIAVVLLMFQMNKNNFLRRKGENFLDKPMILTIILVSLSGLILGFVSFITIPKFTNGSQLTLGYFMGFLFIAFVVLIVPAIKDIFNELNNLRIVKDRINQLNTNDFFKADRIPNDYQLLDGDHPLHRIRHELITAVRESDYEAYSGILTTLNLRAAKLYGDAIDRQLTDGISKGLTYIWQESVFEAAKNNTLQFYKSLWDAIGAMYSNAAILKSPLLHFQEIEHFMHEHIQFLGRNNMGDALTSGIWALTQMFNKNITYNRPEQENIRGLYAIFEHVAPNPHDINSSIQWEYIVGFIESIQQIQQTAIDNRDKELFRTCSFHINHVLNDLSYEQYGKVGDYQEGVIAIHTIGFGQMYLIDALDAEMYRSTLGSYDININFLKHAIEKRRFYVKHVVKTISDFIIQRQRKQQLSSYTILNFGAIGRHSSSHIFTNPVAKEVIRFVIGTLKFMKNEIEANQLPNQSKNYQEIKKQLESQKDFLLSDHLNLQDIVLSEIQDILANFQAIDEDPEFDFVDWPE